MSYAFEQALIGNFEFPKDTVTEAFTPKSLIEKILDIASELAKCTNKRVSGFGVKLFNAAKKGTMFTINGAKELIRIFGELLVLIIWSVTVGVIVITIGIGLVLLLIDLALIFVALALTVGIALITSPETRKNLAETAKKLKNKKVKDKLDVLVNKVNNLTTT